MRIFSEYVNKNLIEVTEEDIYDYIKEINDKLKKNSVLRKVATIRNFYKFCYLNKIVKEDPTGMIKSMKREKRLPEVLSLEEVKKIIGRLYPPRGGLTEMYVADEDREKMNKINDELGELKKKITLLD